MKLYLTAKSATFAFLGLATVGLITYQFNKASGDASENTPAVEQKALIALVPVEVASNGDVGTLGASSVSWPGEILSTADVQIYPAREGQIAEWRVRLGSPVRQGQIIGRLTAGPVSSELVALLADRQKAITQARANAEATAKYIQTTKQNLQDLKLSLDAARDAAVKAAENNLQTLTGPAATTTSTQGIVAIKGYKVREQARKIQQHYINEMSLNYVTTQTDQLYNTYSLRQYVGALDGSSVGNFEKAVIALGDDLKNSTTIPETSVFNFLKAAQKLLLSTLPVDDSHGITADRLTDLRDDIGTDQIEFLDVLNEYKEAKASVENAQGIKNTTVADADAVYAEKKADLNQKTAELDRELALAQAEITAAETAYASIASGIAGQNIIAPKSGVVSIIHQNVGDRVSPDNALAGISSAQATGKFIRFNIPSDMRAPQTGTEVQIERPGFPLEPKKAKIVGVGLSLDANGAYVADAEFLEEVTWPVHASVRVIAPNTSKPILAPFTAIWWNDKGESQVWLVTENNIIRPRTVKVGRAVGDKIEVEEGLEAGERFVARANAELKTGQPIMGTVTVQENTAPAGDGHDHEH